MKLQHPSKLGVFFFFVNLPGLSNGFGDGNKESEIDDSPGRKVEPRRRCASESSISSSNSLLCNSR